MRRLLLVLLLVAVAGAGPAAAHTVLVSAQPAAGSTVDSVDEVVLRFDDPVQPALSTVVVTGPDGVDRSVAGPVLRGGTDLVQAVGGTTVEGRWQVAYRVVADDGHPVVGVLAFDVAGAESAPVGATPRAAPPSPDPPAPSAAAGREPPTGSGATPWLPLAVGTVAGLVLCGGLLAARRRAHRPA